ncbi:PKD domain-containing protein [Kribbella sp. NPDC023972]|uniref:PKD domain-containing protein n=1 Tax=Kribbella sp. NPDC023972 TaxID=3154795 RepID=UPI0033F50A13
MRYRRLVGVAVLVAGGLWFRSAVGVVSTADAAATTIPEAPVIAATPTPPTVIGGQTKSGIELKGSTIKSNRLKRDAPAPKRKKGAAKSADAKNPSGRNKEKSARPDSPVREKDFRLNTGICGLREADGSVPGPARCQPVEPETLTPTRRTLPPVVVQPPPQPQDVTWEQILAQRRVVLFPELTVQVQPKGRTLVNLDTIVYTQDRGVTTATVQLLGFPVTVEATAMSYTWRFGDGAKLTTTSPGKPYPAKEITHKYLKRGAVNLTVTTNYAARFNVAGTGWQYVGGTIPVTGPATPLQVREAVPVLVEPGG